MALIQLKGTAHVRTEMKDFSIKELCVMLYHELIREIKEWFKR